MASVLHPTTTANRYSTSSLGRTRQTSRSNSSKRLRHSFAALRQSVSASFSLIPAVPRPKKDIKREMKFAYVESLIENSRDLPILKRKSKSYLTAPERDLKFKRAAFKKQTQILISQNTKRALLESQAQRRTSALLSKQRRYEIRCQLETVQTINRGWISLLAAVGVLTVYFKQGTNFKVTPKQQLRTRANKQLRWLMHISIILGRLLLRRRRRQRDRQLGRLTRFVIPVKHWLTTRRKVLSRRVTNSLEYSLTNGMVFKLMLRWRQTIVFIQFQVRLFLHFRRGVYKAQLLRLREFELRRSKEQKKRGVKSIIPDKVKLYFVRRLVKEHLARHLSSLQDYRASLRSIALRNSVRQQGNKTAELLHDRAKLVLPTLDLNFSEEEYRQLLLTASSSRLYWERIISQTDY